MAEGGEISAEQTEKLLHFQDLTGMEDMDRCRDILQTHNWELEVAVQDTFNEREGAPTVFTQQREPRTPPVNTSPSDQRIFTVAPRRPTGIFQWSYFFLFFPFRFVYSTLLDIFRFTFRLLRPDPRRNVTDPLGDVMTFIREFEQRYGPIHPTFYQGTYSQALNDAKRELRFLLVYLHGDDHQDTPNFCRDTLCGPDLSEFINVRMLFWACNTNSPEGYRVSQALRENTYPFLALIVLRQNKMTVVTRIEGPIAPTELTAKLTQAMEENEGSLIAARADREERSLNQSLREQQDAAYELSLQADREKERRKREVEEIKQQEEDEVKRKEEEAQRRLEEIAQRKIILRSEIPEEPDSSNAESVRIVLKLPNGTRLDRRFLKTQSIKYLYYFVFCHDEAPDDFQIVSNFPRRVLPCEPSEEVPDPPTFEQVGLLKQEMLFVHDNEA
ncbi:FAS-associated factor 2-like [Lineus longissimus]|uniref:FAS-associated factor 2-like n=1 Tax=Lineus longissimus TaxID=88925 RepID=UPI002B4F518B